MQLNGLIDSIKKNFNSNHIKVSAICKYDDNHKDSLEEVRNIHSDVTFVDETNFKANNLEILSRSHKYCMYLVDDIVMTGPVDVENIISLMSQNPQILNFSLRLGLNLKSCYTLNKVQKIPDGSVFDGKYFAWKWRDGDCDWCYPMSADGHIFKTEIVEQISKLADYNNPNSFESIMHEIVMVSQCPDMSISYLQSKLVNIPVNKVQDYNNNHHGDVTVDELLSMWNNNKKMDISKYQGYVSRAAHEEIDIFVIEREAG